VFNGTLVGPMLNQPPKFDFHYVVYLKSDPAKEPIAVGDSAPGTLAGAAHKTGRPKADFELLEISREQYERLKSLVQL
jgi:hypothetical protein